MISFLRGTWFYKLICRLVRLLIVFRLIHLKHVVFFVCFFFGNCGLYSHHCPVAWFFLFDTAHQHSTNVAIYHPALFRFLTSKLTWMVINSWILKRNQRIKKDALHRIASSIPNAQRPDDDCQSSTWWSRAFPGRSSKELFPLSSFRIQNETWFNATERGYGHCVTYGLSDMIQRRVSFTVWARAIWWMYVWF